MTDCEQTLNNINTLVESIANTQGDNTADILEIKQNVLDLAIGVNDVLNAMIENQQNIINNQKVITENQGALGQQNGEIFELNLAFKDFFQKIANWLGV